MGKEPQAWPAPGSALVTARFLGAESLPGYRGRHPAAENTGPDPVKAAQVTDCYSPQLFLSLRLLAMAVCGIVVARRCHCSCGLLQGRRLLAERGSVLALGAVHSDSEDVAVALVGRSGKEKGGES